ncbi:MAG: aminopeptidase, partial [Ignavibacteriales bacterium]|nr:aminopeptidase [Ignavibacteriales bacterium]
MKYKLFLAVSLLVLVVPDFVLAQGTFSKEINASDVKKHVVFLAGDDLKGRLTGTQECEEAAVYLKKNFAEFGLQVFPGKDWFQKYDFIAGMKKGPDNKLLFLSIDGNNEVTDLDFTPAAFSGSGNFSGELVFVGYGISAPKQKYDDYENLDVKGKIVVAMRYHPEYANPHSEFDDLASFRLKATIAKEKG